ncbi:MAG: class I SAM-dependent methyltransferase [Halobacteriota archaeon]
MQEGKVKIELSGVSETLLGPLWARAKISRDHSSLFYDAKAVELVEKIDYDFSTFDLIPFEDYLPLLFVARAKQFDDKIKAYVKEHPHASVVNIGAGLDATFCRIDNGLIHWYDLDLPAVIDIRRQLLPEPDRTTCIAKSFLDPSWCEDIKHTEEGVFMIAGGLLRYFEEAQVKQFFSMLADNFPGGEIIFNASSRVDNHFGAWIEQLPPDQQKELGAALMETLKGWWDTAPQDQKDKLMSMLKIPARTHSTEWTDVETLWNQHSAKGMREEMRGFMKSSHWGMGLGKWALKDVNEITRWDDRITVMDQSPLFKDIPRDPSWGIAIRQFIDFSDKNRTSNIFHLRV